MAKGVSLLDDARSLRRRLSVAKTESELRGDGRAEWLRLGWSDLRDLFLDLPNPPGHRRLVAESVRRREAEWAAAFSLASWREAPRFDGHYRFAKFRYRFSPDGGVAAPGGRPGRWIAARRRVAFEVPDPQLGGEWRWAGPIGPQSMLLVGRHSSHELPWHEEFVFLPG